MAYTKIRNIKTTINKAIDYITNSEKTNNGKFIYGYNVTPKTASIEFSFTEKMAQNVKGDYKREKGNLAYHIIQSFDYKDILTSGKTPPNPSEMLESRSMENLIERLKDEYDVIIIDSAPLQAVTDAQILSRKADGTIIVVRAEKTKRESVIQAEELLKKVDANILGIVLNGVGNIRKEYYYYY